MAKLSLLLVVFASLLFGKFVAAQQLQRYNVDPSTVTVSGLSAGAAMATQFHFAHSSEVFGVGMIAGLPYNCAGGGLVGLVAATMCMSFPLQTNVNTLINQANSFAASGLIDPVANIRGDPVYIFHGTSDSTVAPGNGRHIETMYAHFGGELRTTFTIAATHGFPTHNWGAACGASSANTAWINNCNYRGAFETLNHLYRGSLILPSDTAAIPGNLLTFAQAEFFVSTPALSSMAATGFVYVPTDCQFGAPCKLHIAFHGCLQSIGNVQNTFALRAGYLEVAEVNNIIVLFPQAASNLSNPNSCFDWWGYLNNNFANRQGNQIIATHRMLSRIIRG